MDTFPLAFYPCNQNFVDPPLISGIFVIFVLIVTSGGLVVITLVMVVPGWYSVLKLVLLVSVVVFFVHCQYESGFHCCVCSVVVEVAAL